MANQIPDFTDNGNLPPGIHEASWVEFERRFGVNASRRKQLEGLRDAVTALGNAGCKSVYVDGSFVTAKEIPGDFDACWDPKGVYLQVLQRLAPALLEFSNGRARQKAVYGGELFPAGNIADLEGPTFLEFFQVDRETGAQKGIVKLDPGDVL